MQSSCFNLPFQMMASQSVGATWHPKPQRYVLKTQIPDIIRSNPSCTLVFPIRTVYHRNTTTGKACSVERIVYVFYLWFRKGRVRCLYTRNRYRDWLPPASCSETSLLCCGSFVTFVLTEMSKQLCLYECILVTSCECGSETTDSNGGRQAVDKQSVTK